LSDLRGRSNTLPFFLERKIEMENVLVPKEVLQKLLDYVRVNEEDDYQECVFNDWSKEDLEKHIFVSVKQLQDCVDSQ